MKKNLFKYILIGSLAMSGAYAKGNCPNIKPLFDSVGSCTGGTVLIYPSGYSYDKEESSKPTRKSSW